MTKSDAIVTLKKITVYPFITSDQKYKISNLLKVIETNPNTELPKELEDKVALANQMKL